MHRDPILQVWAVGQSAAFAQVVADVEEEAHMELWTDTVLPALNINDLPPREKPEEEMARDVAGQEGGRQ